MGNELSKSEEREDQEEGLPENDPELVVGVQNGPFTQQSPPGLNAIKSSDKDTKQIVQQENVITSSQKTIIISPFSNGVTNNQPPAKSKFRMTITRPAPGRTTFQANDPDVGVEKPLVTLGDQPIIQVSNGTPVVLQAKVSGIQNQPPPSALSAEDASVEISESTQGGGASPRPKEISLFQRLFKTEKKVQNEDTLQPEIEVDKEAGVTLEQNSQLQSLPQNSPPSLQNADDSKQASVQVLSADTATLSTTTDTKATQTRSEATQTTPPEEVHPVMSFFKTLVSPNKPGAKAEDEVKNEADDKKKENGGLRKSPMKKQKSKSFSEQTSDAEPKGLKNTESPKTRTLTRFFKQKSKKEEQQGSENKITAQTSKDGGKASKEAAPRPRPFWRKASAEPEAKANTATASAAGSGAKGQETQDKQKKPEDGKNAKPKLMMFFKQLTLDISDGVEITKNEKTAAPAVVESPAQKTKENSKDKKVIAEKATKQEIKESPEATSSSVQQQVPEPAAAQNGADSAKESQMKRTEKRQSLGSFFKAIGPKRMCDAEVQTDPVSILPAEKVK